MTVHELIVEAEHLKSQAIVARDAAALGRCLADDLVFVHSNGKIDSRASFIALVGTGQYVGWTQTELEVKVYGGLAVIAGHRSVEVQRGDVRRTVDTRFVDVWVQHGDAWRNTHSQSSPILV